VDRLNHIIAHHLEVENHASVPDAITDPHQTAYNNGSITLAELNAYGKVEKPTERDTFGKGYNGKGNKVWHSVNTYSNTFVSGVASRTFIFNLLAKLKEDGRMAGKWRESGKDSSVKKLMTNVNVDGDLCLMKAKHCTTNDMVSLLKTWCV
jgi:hypothetical protein